MRLNLRHRSVDDDLATVSICRRRFISVIFRRKRDTFTYLLTLFNIGSGMCRDTELRRRAYLATRHRSFPEEMHDL